MFRFVKRVMALFMTIAVTPLAAADCLSDTNLLRLENDYEQAIRTADVAWLERTLAEDFIWVHNHASAYESRAMLMARLRAEDYQPPKSRELSEVSVIRQGDTAVVYGLSTVDKHTEGARHANRYHFMRTWLKTPVSCRLLAGQTMKVWSTEGNDR